MKKLETTVIREKLEEMIEVRKALLQDEDKFKAACANDELEALQDLLSDLDEDTADEVVERLEVEYNVVLDVE